MPGTVPTFGHMGVKTESFLSLTELTVDVENWEYEVNINYLQRKLYYFPLQYIDQVILTCEILITQIVNKFFHNYVMSLWTPKHGK